MNKLFKFLALVLALYSVNINAQGTEKSDSGEAVKKDIKIKWEGSNYAAEGFFPMQKSTDYSFSYVDKFGKNIVKLQNTGIKVNASSGKMRGYAQISAINNLNSKIVWQMQEEVKDCNGRVQLNFLYDYIRASDLNDNEIAEIWLPYVYHCSVDNFAAKMKIVVFEAEEDKKEDKKEESISIIDVDSKAVPKNPEIPADAIGKHDEVIEVVSNIDNPPFAGVENADFVNSSVFKVRKWEINGRIIAPKLGAKSFIGGEYKLDENIKENESFKQYGIKLWQKIISDTKKRQQEQIRKM